MTVRIRYRCAGCGYRWSLHRNCRSFEMADKVENADRLIEVPAGTKSPCTCNETEAE